MSGHDRGDCAKFVESQGVTPDQASPRSQSIWLETETASQIMLCSYLGDVHHTAFGFSKFCPARLKDRRKMLEDKRYAAACHEAAHAVICLRLNQTFK